MSLDIEACFLRTGSSIGKRVCAIHLHVDTLTVVDGDGGSRLACQRDTVKHDGSFETAVRRERAIRSAAAEHIADFFCQAAALRDANVGTRHFDGE